MKTTTISIIASALLIGGAFLFVLNSGSGKAGVEENNVTVVDGRQIIDVRAKGGYAPRVSVAKAGIPNVIKVKTDGTYDCSAALAIPAIGFKTFLPPTGVTDIELPPQEPGTTLQALCSMGMFNFQVRFN